MFHSRAVTGLRGIHTRVTGEYTDAKLYTDCNYENILCEFTPRKINNTQPTSLGEKLMLCRFMWKLHHVATINIEIVIKANKK